MPLLRKLGIRTQREIDEERFALKMLRGDFADVGAAEPHTAGAEQILQAVEA